MQLWEVIFQIRYKHTHLKMIEKTIAFQHFKIQDSPPTFLIDYILIEACV